jgi:hypothetical protein
MGQNGPEEGHFPKTPSNLDVQIQFQWPQAGLEHGRDWMPACGAHQPAAFPL